MTYKTKSIDIHNTKESKEETTSTASTKDMNRVARMMSETDINRFIYVCILPEKTFCSRAMEVIGPSDLAPFI